MPLRRGIIFTHRDPAKRLHHTIRCLTHQGHATTRRCRTNRILELTLSLVIKHEPQARIAAVDLQLNPQLAIRKLTRHPVYKCNGGVALAGGRLALELQSCRPKLQIIPIATLTRRHQGIAKIHLQTRHRISFPLELVPQNEILRQLHITAGKGLTLRNQRPVLIVPCGVIVIRVRPLTTIARTLIDHLARMDAKLHRCQMPTLDAQLSQHRRIHQNPAPIHLDNRTWDHIAIDQLDPHHRRLEILRTHRKLNLLDHRPAQPQWLI